ncbi:MAG: sulfotransferase, partial [Actinomycetota bacterium]|nr:sulfotransferase [Actinomycetota bacterium]
MTHSPLLILGVRRSGTTLLRVMLDRNPELALPDESYFLPQLAHRQGRRPDFDEFLDDVRRLPTLRE